MVIQHSLKLLEQLSKIEKQISQMEEVLKKLDVEIDEEELLLNLIKKH